MSSYPHKGLQGLDPPKTSPRFNASSVSNDCTAPGSTVDSKTTRRPSYTSAPSIRSPLFNVMNASSDSDGDNVSGRKDLKEALKQREADADRSRRIRRAEEQLEAFAQRFNKGCNKVKSDNACGISKRSDSESSEYRMADGDSMESMCGTMKSPVGRRETLRQLNDQQEQTMQTDSNEINKDSEKVTPIKKAKGFSRPVLSASTFTPPVEENIPPLTISKRRSLVARERVAEDFDKTKLAKMEDYPALSSTDHPESKSGGTDEVIAPSANTVRSELQHSSILSGGKKPPPALSKQQPSSMSSTKQMLPPLPNQTSEPPRQGPLASSVQRAPSDALQQAPFTPISPATTCSSSETLQQIPSFEYPPIPPSLEEELRTQIRELEKKLREEQQKGFDKDATIKYLGEQLQDAVQWADDLSRKLSDDKLAAKVYREEIQGLTASNKMKSELVEEYKRRMEMLLDYDIRLQCVLSVFARRMQARINTYEQVLSNAWSRAAGGMAEELEALYNLFHRFPEAELLFDKERKKKIKRIIEGWKAEGFWQKTAKGLSQQMIKQQEQTLELATMEIHVRYCDRGTQYEQQGLPSTHIIAKMLSSPPLRTDLFEVALNHLKNRGSASQVNEEGRLVLGTELPKSLINAIIKFDLAYLHRYLLENAYHTGELQSTCCFVEFPTANGRQRFAIDDVVKEIVLAEGNLAKAMAKAGILTRLPGRVLTPANINGTLAVPLTTVEETVRIFLMQNARKPYEPLVVPSSLPTAPATYNPEQLASQNAQMRFTFVALCTHLKGVVKAYQQETDARKKRAVKEGLGAMQSSIAWMLAAAVRWGGAEGGMPEAARMLEGIVGIAGDGEGW